MSSSSLNTLLVQRIETALGVPLAQHTQLAGGARTHRVPAAGSTADIATLETATAKPDFPQTLLARTGPNAAHIATGKAPGAAPPPAAAPDLSSAAQMPASSSAASRSAHMHLSEIGRILLPLLEQFPQGGGPLTSTQPLFISAVLALRAQMASSALQQDAPFSAEKPPGPLLPAQATSPPALSSALTGALMQILRGQITHSGLFYESHLLRQMQRSGGKFIPLTDEPQHHRPLPGVDDTDIDPALHAVVRQQLDLLAGQPVQWQGPLWPGAHMQWVISIPDPHGQPAQTPDTQRPDDQLPWISTLELDLPNLGQVSVRIDIRGPAVSLHLAVDETGLPLGDYLEGMHKNLVKAGLDPQFITVTLKSDQHE